ncbi:MAG: S28 family serine protease [Gemmatimonadota bacterium]|jgi:hypothetical protein
MRRESRTGATCDIRTVAAGLRLAAVVASVALAASCRDSAGPEPVGSLLDRLNALPGVVAQEIAPLNGYPREFQLDITQPVDHDNPSGPTFTQRAYLSHVSESAPMVFAPSGYGSGPNAGNEVAWILQGNNLSVVHRYFPDARPASLDWQYLDIRQAAADHHRIVSLLKGIYTGAWVSTGSSKGGETVLFHRRSWPDDVDATVAYVAPLLEAVGDERFPPWVRSRGTPADRAAILDFQRRLLERKADLLDDYEAWFDSRGITFSLPVGPGFESAVTSYEFNFWQRHVYTAAQIPGPTASDAELIGHLADVVRLEFDGDVWRDYFSAYVYQALTEIGLPAIDSEPLADLLSQDSIDTRQAYGFPPALAFDYRPDVMADIVQWVRTRGDRIILIYGEDDPWTAGAVGLTGQTDALEIIQPGADHQVRIAGLDQRDAVLAKLSAWLGFPVTIPVAGAIRAAPPPAEPFRGLDRIDLRTRL